MVTNWAEGSKEAGAVEQIFYIAVQMQEPKNNHLHCEWQTHAKQSDSLACAYRIALDVREKLVSQAGMPLVQDLHLNDADVGINNPENMRKLARVELKKDASEA